MANPDSKLTAKDFLTAAESRLQNPEKAIDLVHAALDVRLGIEARLNEYLDAYQRAVGSRPKSWKLAQLERKVEAAFRTGGKLVRLEVVDATNDQVVSEHWYTPVTKDLRKMGEKIGNALHYGA